MHPAGKLVELALFLVGLGILLYGSNTVVTEAGQIVLYYGVSTFFVGVTVISIGPSIPEMTRSLFAASYGAGNLVVGNIVGSEIVEEVIDDLEPPRRTVPWILLGLGMVVVGGQLLVTNGVALARLVGIGEFLIGLLTGLGTTLPEIVVAGLAAKRGDTGPSIGSLLGSNITDPVFSPGIGALVADVVVTDLAAVQLSAPYLGGVSVVVLGPLYWRRGLRRRWAIVPMVRHLPSFVVL